MDDHPELFEQLAGLLEPEYLVDTACSSEQALQKTRADLPDLIATDVLMPGLDGIGLLKALRADVRTRAIPILLVSGRPEQEARIEAFETGADGYLTKPFTLRELRAHIRATLDGTRMRAELARSAATAEAELARARERTAILESITDGFYALDRQWRFTYVNQRALDHFQRTREDLVGRTLWECFPIALGTAFQRQYERAVQERCTVEFEVLSPISNRWLEVHAFPRPDGLTVSFRDITARKEAEEDLIVHSHVLESMSDGVSLCDETGHIVYTNPAEDRMFGYTPGELIGQHVMVQNAYPPEENQRVVAGVIETLKRGEAWSGEWHNRRKDGRTFFTAARISPLERRGQRFWVCVQRDVTAQKAAAQERREHEERFRLMADTAPVLIWIADTSRNCIWFNRPWLKFTGHALEQALGFGWARGIHPEDLDDSIETYTAAFEARREFSIEYRRQRADGAYRWVLDHGLPLYEGDSGEFSGCIGSCVDITRIKEAEAEHLRTLVLEREAREESERVGRLKDEFLATLSHELRTPLHAMLGWAGVLQQRGCTEATLAQGLESIARNARAQSTIINDLLDMSAIVSGKIKLDVRPLDLHDVLKAALSAVHPAASAKGVRVSSTLDARIGLVRGDTDRLQQVFWNLLNNAVKFTPSGGRIHVVLEQVNSHVEVSVEDSGSGISREFLPYVFDRFRQADASITRRAGGLGLGLSIVRSLVEVHGGSVRAKSPGPDQGSTFIVALPMSSIRGDDVDAHRRLTVAPRRLPGEPPSIEGARILVVDDESDALKLLAHILQTQGARVALAPSAREALKRLDSERFDLLVSDIGMPDTDGYELIRIVRRRGRLDGGAVPAIAVTAFAGTEDRRQALLAGFQQHIAKPVEPAELVAAAASLIFLTRSH